MNEIPRGAVFAEDAYALGKMLDHSSWQSPRGGERPLPRRVTPSDIDMTGGEFSGVQITFDNNDRMLICELSSLAREWSEIKRGQKRNYYALLRGGPHCAVLAHHSVKLEQGRKINSRYDIDSFHPVIYDHGFLISPVISGNHAWQEFVLSWFDDAEKTRRAFIAKSLPTLPAFFFEEDEVPF